MSSEFLIDPTIEAALLSGLLLGRPEVIRSGLVRQLHEGLFSAKSYQWLVGKGFATHQPPITPPVLSQMLIEAFPNIEEREQHALALMPLYSVDASYLEDAVGVFRRYLAFQTASAACKTFFTNFGRSRNVPLSIKDLTDGLDRAKDLLQGRRVQVVDYASTFSEREQRRKFARDNPHLRPSLKLGISKFDQQVKMAPGTVTNFLAPMKRYKSVILTSLAYAALLQGFNVVLVVVENTLDLTMDRLDAMFSQISYDRIVHYLKTKAEKEYADQLLARVNSWPQRLKILKGDPYKTSVKDVQFAVDALCEEEGFRSDVEIYDYLNIMGTSVVLREEHERQERIMWEMQERAKEDGHERIIATGTQTNMAGAEVDKDGKPVRIQIQHQGKSIGLIQAADSTVAVNLELGKVEGNLAQLPQIILSPLVLRNAPILYPDVRLVSQIDQMCLDREQRRLWDEADDSLPAPRVPA